MKLREFAKEYIEECGLDSSDTGLNILVFIDTWEKHLTELKQQYIKDKPSLHPEDLSQAKRHLLIDRTIDIIKMASNLMDFGSNPNFIKGGETNSGEPSIILDNGEKIMEPKISKFQQRLKEMMDKQSTNDK